MDGKATATELVTYLINASTDTESAANGSGNRLRVSVGFLLMNLVAFMIWVISLRVGRDSTTFASDIGP